jgi:hypothetical protein
MQDLILRTPGAAGLRLSVNTLKTAKMLGLRDNPSKGADHEVEPGRGEDSVSGILKSLVDMVSPTRSGSASHAE